MIRKKRPCAGRCADSRLSEIDFMYFFKYADELIADGSVLMQTAEVPPSVTRVVHDGVEKDVQIIDSGAAVDHPLDGRGRFMGDDDIQHAALFFDIDHRVLQLLVGGQGRGGFCFVRFGRQTAA